MTAPIRTLQDSVAIAASPEAVFALVTSMERYGEWSSENTGGYWRKGADGVPGTGKVGDQFVGVNRQGEREWKAAVEIIEVDPPRAFAFVTGGVEMNIALWRYQIEPTEGGCRLTESYELRTQPPQMLEGGQAAMDERITANVASIRATLTGIKAAAEG
ncbi:MAG: SRPBCC family protein [Acidimicrobiales bacterium]